MLWVASFKWDYSLPEEVTACRAESCSGFPIRNTFYYLQMICQLHPFLEQDDKMIDYMLATSNSNVAMHSGPLGLLQKHIDTALSDNSV